MKGIILAAGKGTRLSPVSDPISKVLLPVYSKPMIYYPLSTLMLAGIKDIMVITSHGDKKNFIKTLGDGSQFGIKISYKVQRIHKGIADAFIIAEKFIAGDRSVLILGDNIYHGDGMKELMRKAHGNSKGCTVFLYEVSDPERFGVAEVDDQGNVISLEEKPTEPKSNLAVTGLYFYDGDVCRIAKTLTPSARGELEITDLNKVYMARGALKACRMDKGYKWIDAGTFNSLLDAQNIICEIEKSTGRMVACPEEIAVEMGYMTASKIRESISGKKSEYYDKIRDGLDGKRSSDV